MGDTRSKEEPCLPRVSARKVMVARYSLGEKITLGKSPACLDSLTATRRAVTILIRVDMLSLSISTRLGCVAMVDTQRSNRCKMDETSPLLWTAYGSANA